MVRAAANQDRVASAILDAAAEVFARSADAPMSGVAAAAGVGRATLYRYFPTREALLNGMVRAAIGELSAGLAAAELDRVSVDEGIARVARGFVSAGLKYAALAQVDKTAAAADELDRKLAEPVRTLLRRGIAEGSLRTDLPLEVQFELFTGLLEKTLLLVARGEYGVESASAALVTVFLDGARAAGS